MGSGRTRPVGQYVKKTKRFMIFDPKKGGLFRHFDPPPLSPPSLKKAKNWVSSVGGGGGGLVRTKNFIGGCIYWTK